MSQSPQGPYPPAPQDPYGTGQPGPPMAPTPPPPPPAAYQGGYPGADPQAGAQVGPYQPPGMLPAAPLGYRPPGQEKASQWWSDDQPGCAWAWAIVILVILHVVAGLVYLVWQAWVYFMI